VGVLASVQIIGANIFPYWSKIAAHVTSPDKPFCTTAGQSVACETQNTAANVLKQVKNPIGSGIKSTVTGLIVTEEGWPSCASDGQPKTNQTDESDYYTTWNQHANQTFDSYYFQTYDLKTAICDGGADLHFGLCTATGGTKDSGLISCPAGTGSKPSRPSRESR
jgi:exo-beta-1,3-glucanase (GH17 family)